MSSVPQIKDIEKAAARLDGIAHRTPLLEFSQLNERTGGRILIKPELLQRTGSFKFRGAYNRISQLDPARFPGGVVACSSGNHAQGVAEACSLMGMKAVLVMPSDAPEAKKRGVIERGGKVVEYDRVNEDRDRIARDIAEERCAAFVPPFDDFDIIAGQGTAGLEITEDLRRKHIQPDALLVPCSGGGLIAGCATALSVHFPQTRIYAVEPEGFDDHRRSLEAGARQKNDRMDGSICDALLAAEPGQLTFQINRKLLSGSIAISDDDVRMAMAYAILGLKLVPEPGGAIALAAVLSGRFDAQGKTVALVMSGGNADKNLICDTLDANGAAAQQ